jgi:hypothetical protein
MKDKLSHPHKATHKIIVKYIRFHIADGKNKALEVVVARTLQM